MMKEFIVWRTDFPRMKKLLILSLVIASPAFAQTGRWGLVINSETKQCSRFWEGNECEKVTVPAAWKPAFPEWIEKDQVYKLTFGDKSCAWSGSAPEKCCADLGLKFDKDFKSASAKTGLEKNPDSMCYQISDPK